MDLLSTFGLNSRLAGYRYQGTTGVVIRGSITHLYKIILDSFPFLNGLMTVNARS